MYTFNSQQIKELLSAADIKMKAMIWLGVNSEQTDRVIENSRKYVIHGKT